MKCIGACKRGTSSPFIR